VHKLQQLMAHEAEEMAQLQDFESQVCLCEGAAPPQLLACLCGTCGLPSQRRCRCSWDFIQSPSSPASVSNALIPYTFMQ